MENDPFESAQKEVQSYLQVSLKSVFSRSNLKILFSTDIRSSHPEVFLEIDVLKICSKFTGEHPC